MWYILGDLSSSLKSRLLAVSLRDLTKWVKRQFQQPGMKEYTREGRVCTVRVR